MKPPYSNTLDRQHHELMADDVWVVIGSDAWVKGKQFAREGRWVLVCPPGENPARRDWSLVSDAPVPLSLVRAGEVDGTQFQQLLVQLLCHHPRVYDLLADTPYVAKRVVA